MLAGAPAAADGRGDGNDGSEDAEEAAEARAFLLALPDFVVARGR